MHSKKNIELDNSTFGDNNVSSNGFRQLRQTNLFDGELARGESKNTSEIV